MPGRRPKEVYSKLVPATEDETLTPEQRNAVRVKDRAALLKLVKNLAVGQEQTYFLEEEHFRAGMGFYESLAKLPSDDSKKYTPRFSRYGQYITVKCDGVPAKYRPER